MNYRNWTYLPLLLSCALVVTGLAAADEDHEHARRLQEAGDILPLESILQRAHAHTPGQVIEVELESEHGQHRYEVEILDADGVVRELYFDARSGEFLNAETED